MRRVLVVTWNGKDVPPEMGRLPVGHYVVQPMELVHDADDVEEIELDESDLDEIDSGEPVSWEDLRMDLGDLG